MLGQGGGVEFFEGQDGTSVLQFAGFVRVQVSCMSQARTERHEGRDDKGSQAVHGLSPFYNLHRGGTVSG
ncbi:hypothetical protein D3C84_932580 [compost metagenome]